MKGFMPEYYNWTSHGEERVQEYVDAVTAPPLQDEQTTAALVDEGTSTQLGDATQINWAQRMFLDAAGPVFCSSTYSQDGAPDDGTRSCPLGGPSSYYYGDGPMIMCPCCKIDFTMYACCRAAFVERYKPARVRNPNGKKTTYAVLRYLPITPRLQRLYVSKTTAKQMTWHTTHQTEERSMVHPSDAEAWKHFDRTHLDFTAELRNVRLGLCTDGFEPHGQYGRTYSCWPVILTTYNLPPGMCMSSEYMFLMMVIPGPYNPKRLIDIYLEPLIEELQNLWHVGVQTHDNVKDETFTIRAALIWIVNNLLAYVMTSGVMGCPVCMEDTRAFYLRNGRKACYFDCHRQFLPADHPY
ncbi:UNVERIFIED_CONTAM: hypothetical protein Slati_0809100 [Sesamum latifolium]|uniref:Transposase n=1 Tax=Sesamum latifolium TaxID=2727402 RepID=A0AAW2XKM6_9LAMI